MQSSAAISPGRAGSRYPLPLSATTPLSLKEGQYTDIFLKLHLVLSASPCLKLSGDPEVIGDIHSLCFSKTGKEKRQKGTPLREKTTVYKRGTSSPLLLPGARRKTLLYSLIELSQKRQGDLLVPAPVNCRESPRVSPSSPHTGY